MELLFWMTVGGLGGIGLGLLIGYLIHPGGLRYTLEKRRMRR